MRSLEKRIEILVKLGNYMRSNHEEWQEIKHKAVNANAWFTLPHIELAVENIINELLDEQKLKNWAAQYELPNTAKKVGIVMAGNIPLVGFHDFICGFISGHILYLKLSSKDEVLIKHLIHKMIEWDAQLADHIIIAENLKNLDAYIATGSNNTARYFEQYFAKYPHIIRKNRTSVAILEGDETEEELQLLANDIFTYFGLGCRNVTQVCVPEGYDFTKMIDAFIGFEDYINHNKYKNNFDYYLAIYLLNKVHYLTNNFILVVENELPFSAVSVLHYRYYKDMQQLAKSLEESNEIQAIVGKGFTPFGMAQVPSLNDYADGVDTMQFLCTLH